MEQLFNTTNPSNYFFDAKPTPYANNQFTDDNIQMRYSSNPPQEVPDNSYNPLEYMLTYARQELVDCKDNTAEDENELYENCGSDVDSIIGVRH
jgi:hypothetical protein